MVDRTDGAGAVGRAARAAVEALEGRQLLTTATLHPTDDAYVRDGTYADTAEGVANTSQVQVKTIGSTSFTRDGYLKFAVSVPAGNRLNSATLRMYGQAVVGSTYTGPTITGVPVSAFPLADPNAAWGESTLTWNNAPGLSGTGSRTTELASTTFSTAASTWYTMDVTSFVTPEAAAGRSPLTVGLHVVSNLDAQANIDSDEAANRPELVLDYSPASELVLTDTAVTVREGGTATVGVHLSAPPSGTAVVSVAKLRATDPDVNTAATALTFTADNWQIDQAVSFSAGQDADAANGTAKFVFSGGGQAAASVSVTEADDDVTLAPAADATVRDGSFADTSFGSATTLEVKNSNTAGSKRRGLLEFDLSGAPRYVSSATLRVFGSASGTGTFPLTIGVKTPTTPTAGWADGDQTWNTQPVLDANPIATVAVGATPAWYEFDVTAYVQAQRAAGNQFATLALTAELKELLASFNSNEAAANPPQLALIAVPSVGTVGGTIYADLNGDGSVTAGEPVAAAGLSVYLDDNNNNAADDSEVQTVTDQDGNYTFDGVQVVPRLVRVAATGGWSAVGAAAAGRTATLSGTVTTSGGNDLALIPPPPTVSVNNTTDVAIEDDPSPATFTVYRTTFDLSQPLTLPYTVGGTATAGTDYVALSGSVTIPAGSDSADVVVSPIDDAAAEGDETVTLVLGTGAGYALATPSDSAVVIRDFDGVLPDVSVSTAQAYGDESTGTPAVFTLQRAGRDMSSALTVAYSMGGTATNGTDYASLGGTAVIPAGASSVDVVVAPTADGVADGKESVVLTVSASAAYNDVGLFAATAFVSDQPLPVVTLVATVPTVFESSTGTPGVFTISRAGPDLSQPLAVTYEVAGDATPGTDYTALSGTATIPAGAASTTVTVDPINDSAGEGDESIFLSLTDGPSYGLGDGARDLVTLSDPEDTTPTSPSSTPTPTPTPKVYVMQYDGTMKEYTNNGTVTVFAGEPLQLQAVQGTSVASNAALFDTSYRWEFSDQPAAAKTRLQSRRLFTDPKNPANNRTEYDSFGTPFAGGHTVNGFNTAHVWEPMRSYEEDYDKRSLTSAQDPGKWTSYPATVKLIVNGVTSTLKVTVLNPVAAGFGVQKFTASDGLVKIQTAIDASKGDKSGKGLISLLHAGDTFTYDGSRTVGLTASKPHLIFDWYGYSQYGTSALPEIRDITPNTENRIVFVANANTDYLTVRHLQVSDVENTVSGSTDMIKAVNYLKRTPDVISANGAKNVALMYSRFGRSTANASTSTLDSIDGRGKTQVKNGIIVDQYVTGVLLQGNTDALAFSRSMNLGLLHGSQLVVQGNYLQRSKDEHGVRFMNWTNDATGVVTQFTQFVNVSNNRIDMGTSSKETVSVRYASHSYVSNNTFVGGHLQVGDSNHGPTYRKGIANWTVVENNTQTMTANKDVPYGFVVIAPASNVIFRDNKVHSSLMDGAGFYVGGDPYYVKGDSNSGDVAAPRNLLYKTNTVYEDNTAADRNGAFLKNARIPTNVVLNDNTMSISPSANAWKGFNLDLAGAAPLSIFTSHLNNHWATGALTAGTNRLHRTAFGSSTKYYDASYAPHA